MSLAVSPFHVFRSCRASVASRKLSLSAFSGPQTRHHLSRIGMRHYSSNEKSSSETTQPPGEPDTNGTPAEVDPCADVKNSLITKESEVLDLTGRLRYLQADFLNLQRNAAREKEQTRDYAISRFAGDLLETVDVLSMALKSVPPDAVKVDPPSTPSGSQQSIDTSSSTPLPKSHATYLRELHTGVEITHRLLLQTLFKYQIKPFDPTGDQFDPNHHEALYQAPVPGKEPGTIIDCQKTGYLIKDRVLRAAQVGVAQELS